LLGPFVFQMNNRLLNLLIAETFPPVRLMNAKLLN
jgi:hypothetical protein